MTSDVRSPGRQNDDGSWPEERALAARLLQAEAAAVAALAGRLGPDFHEAVALIVRCADGGGTVLVTGLGKSGLVGAKIAATLKSLGIASHPIHPSEAAHGDLGAFRPTDLCLALSYSGETEEVVGLASILKQDGIPIVAITGSDDGSSALERIATVPLTVGRVDEANGLSPAPACSTTAMMALGDALAFAAARRRKFTDDDFARRHPGGSLGGLLRPVLEALRFEVGKNLVPIEDDLTVSEALRLSSTPGRRPGAILLVSRQSGRLTGIFTDGDLRRLIVRSPRELERPIRELMTRSPRTLPRTALLRDARRLVLEQRCDEIPVVDEEGRPVGILDVQDLIAMKVVSG
jgi:arabinose-5-phosphate isomerase